MQQKNSASSRASLAWLFEQKSAFPTYIDLLAMAGIFLVAQLVVAAIGMFVVSLKGYTPLLLPSNVQGTFVAVVSFFSLTLTIAALILYRRMRGGERVKISLGKGKFNLLLVAWSFLLMLALSVVMEPLYELLPLPKQNFGTGVGAFLAVVVFAPLFEEVICRGMVFGSLLKRHSIPVAILLSALFFGVLHVQMVSMLNAFLMGVVLAFVYHRTQTLWTPVLLHAMNNGSAYLMERLGLGEQTLSQLLEGYPVIYSLIYGFALVVAVASIWGMVQALKPRSVATPTTASVGASDHENEKKTA